MAKPARAVPDEATNREPERPEEGREAIDAVIDEYGGDYADAIEHTEELENLVETAVLVVASADDDEVEQVTQTVVTLVKAADGISSEGTVELAERLGENADEFVDLLDTVMEMQETGQLDDLLDTVMEMQESGQLEDLLELAGTLSALEIDEDAVDGINSLLAATSDATHDSEPVGMFGALRALSTRDAKAGLGYLVAILKGLGRRLR